MAFAVSGKLDGLGEVLAKLNEVERKVRTKILRDALGEAARLILRSAKAKVPRGETGLLRRSLGIKMKVYRKSGAVVALVGPRTGFRKSKGGRVRTALGDKFAAAGVKPHLYAHLVEKGRRAVTVQTAKVLSDGSVIFGRRVAAVPARPFLRPAFDENKAAAETLIRVRIREGLEEI
jgi:HK97 gp10 family phage protein